MKTMLIDDERKANIALQRMIEEHCPALQIVGAFQNINEACAAIKHDAPELIFLDVEMAHETGFDLLKEFPNRNFRVVFVTAHSQYAIKAIRKEAHDYLLKPVMLDELLEAVARLNDTNLKHKRHEETHAHSNPFEVLPVPTGDGRILLRQHEIIRLQGDGAYTHIYSRSQKQLTASYNLGFFERQLNPERFLRCHKSHIINVHNITKILRNGGYAVQMLDNSRIDVSKTYRGNFDTRMKSLLQATH